jgi:hypothetical protein
MLLVVTKMGISPFTSYSGRLALVNAVLSALPTYYMSVLELPLEIIEQISKYMRHCFLEGLRSK